MSYFEHGSVEILIADSPIAKRHTHDFLELAFVLNGSAKHEMEGYKATISAGDYFIVDYGAAHEYKQIGDEPLSVLNVLFLPEFIDKSLIYCRSFTTLLRHYLIKINVSGSPKNPFGGVFTDKSGEIGALLMSMKDEYERKQAGFTEIIRSKLIELLILTARKSETIDAPQDPVSYAVAAVDENPSNPPTLYEIADKFGFSTPYLSAKFKEETGRRYRDYVIEKRMEEARRLLANSNDKISSVAASVGYADVNRFYDVFRRSAGVSPAVFRKNCKK